MKKKIISGSVKNSFAMIWRNKLLFISLFALQVLFFSLFLYASTVYLPRMFGSAKAISDYISRQNLDDISVAQNVMQQKNILGEDPLSISRNYTSLVGSFSIYLEYSFAMLVLFLSISWTLTARMSHKTSFKKMLEDFAKKLLVLLSCFGAILFFFFSIVEVSFSDSISQGLMLFAKYIPMLIFSAALLYFMFIALSISGSESLKALLHKTFSVGIRKFHYMIAAYLISLFFVMLSVILITYFTENNLFGLLLSMVFFVFVFVFCRIFIFNVVDRLSKE